MRAVSDCLSPPRQFRRVPFLPSRRSGKPWKEPPMLVLTRKVGETLVIGDTIHVVVIAVRGEQVRLGIQAPPEITVDREEIHAARAANPLAVPVALPVQGGKP